MDKLGVSAKMGLDVVVRQSYFWFDFALVDENYLPRPVSSLIRGRCPSNVL